MASVRQSIIQAQADVQVQPGGWWHSPWWCPHAAPLCLSDRNLNILQYCPSADLWTLFETCDVHIRKQQMVSVEETIYIVGGCLHELGPTRRGSQSEDMLTVQSYNTATRQWLYLKENTSKSGLNLTCALHNDGIYIMSRDVTLSTSLSTEFSSSTISFQIVGKPLGVSQLLDTICWSLLFICPIKQKPD